MIPYGGDINKLDGPRDPKLLSAFRRGMLLNGVDLAGTGGWMSAAMTEDDVEKTVEAVSTTLEGLKAEQLI